MDETRRRWYFSWVGRRDGVRTFKFLERKYGRDLLVDVEWVHDIPTFVTDAEPHALEFHDALLVTRGSGTFEVDGARFRVRPGAVLLTPPRRVRRWRAERVDGVCLFFTEAFVGGFFADARFLDRFGLFPRRGGRALYLSAPRARRLRSMLLEMRREIRRGGADAEDAVRARLYEALVLLRRAARTKAGTRELPDLARRFDEAVERLHAVDHAPSSYARRLGVSAGHLTQVCRAAFGRTAGAFIRSRVMLEASRRLAYTDAPAQAIGADLGFVDPSYFSRAFARETGRAPLDYRRERLTAAGAGGTGRRTRAARGRG